VKNGAYDVENGLRSHIERGARRKGARRMAQDDLSEFYLEP
jgi:hypothetical protein